MKTGRKKFDSHPVGPAEDGRPLDDVAELSDVARPGIAVERLERFRGKAQPRPMVGRAVEGQEPLGQGDDVFRPFA